jgi:hypothetical protein
LFKIQIINLIPTAKGRFHIHFAPDVTTIHYNSTFAKDDNVLIPTNVFDQSYGIKHWMENVLGYSPDGKLPPKDKDTIVIILEQDQLVLTPFVEKYSDEWMVNWDGINTNRPESLVLNDTFTVRRGTPFAQNYGISGNFFQVMKENEIVLNSIEKAFNLKRPTSFRHKDSNLRKLTGEEIDLYYNAGPPYIGFASDIYDIVTVWSSIIVPVYYLCDKQGPVDLYSYNTAAALLNLKHQLATTFMFSDPKSSHEVWDYAENNDNRRKNDAPLSLATQRHVFRYCQEYAIGPYYFHPYHVPDMIFTCEHPLFLEPSLSNTWKADGIPNPSQQLDFSSCLNIATKDEYKSITRITNDGKMINMTFDEKH